MKKLLLVAAVITVIFYLNRQPAEVGQAPGPERGLPVAQESDAMAGAWASRKSGILVSGRGRVTRLLGDDSLGDRHQRFILTLDSGQSVLVAHNIDLAARVEALREGDVVEFSGEYEWNDKGGIAHWTHRDPQGQHEPGWLKHRGRTYE